MKFLKWCNILSIDVALGSLAMTMMIAKSIHVEMDVIYLCLLPAAVWWIYTADHLSDARKASNKFLSERHAFHLRHFKILLWLLFMVGFAGFLTAMYYLDKKLWMAGVAIAFVSALYLLYSFLWKKYILPKEIVVAIVYTAGVAYGPVILKNFELNMSKMALLVAVFFTAWYNLLVFSMIGQTEDEKSGFGSIVNAIGIKKTAILATIVFVLNIMVLLFISLSDVKMVIFAIALTIINVVLLFVNIKKEKFIGGNQYRLIGDMVFMLPFIPVILN